MTEEEITAARMYHRLRGRSAKAAVITQVLIVDDNLWQLSLEIPKGLHSVKGSIVMFEDCTAGVVWDMFEVNGSDWIAVKPLSSASPIYPKPHEVVEFFTSPVKEP